MSAAENKVFNHITGKEEVVPDFTRPVDVREFCFSQFGACGCTDLVPLLEVVRDFLKWADNTDRTPDDYWDSLFGGHTGIYYIVAGMLDNAGLLEHGSSLRFPWLTPTGKNLLVALQSSPLEAFEQATGTSYNGDYFEPEVDRNHERDEAEDEA